MAHGAVNVAVWGGILLLLGAVAQAEELVVDFARPLGPATQRACGFLHGIKADSPEESLLSPLKIRYIRGTPHSTSGLPGLLEEGTLKRLDRPGLRLAVGVYYYDRKKVAGHDDYLPGEKGDWASWERIVESTVNEARGRNVNCYWVIWNEPDYAKFWPHDVERFRETWRRAFRKIKLLDAEAVITGPTISKYSFEYLTAFLSYCRKNECVPDLLTWHELSRFEDHVSSHVEETRRWCEQNDIAIKGIVVDEYGGKTSQHWPGAAVGFISSLEKAKVTFASRAIWTKTGTLCGATTEDGGKPTGLWWAYKAYCDIGGTLYDVVETANLRVVAGADEAAASIVVLIGNQSKDPRPANLVLQNLAKARIGMRQCLVRRRLIPNTEANGLEAPDTLPEMTVEAANDTLKIDVGVVPAYGAVEVTVCQDGPKAGRMESRQ